MANILLYSIKLVDLSIRWAKTAAQLYNEVYPYLAEEVSEAEL